MRILREQLAAALDEIAETISRADNEFHDFLSLGRVPDVSSGEWNLELAYVQLMVLSETLELPLLRKQVATTLHRAKKSKGGLCESVLSPDGDEYLKWGGTAHQFRLALQAVYMTESAQTVTKDLETILRGVTYSITDRDVFGECPANENDVHRRIEAVLKCIFPDLLHKPQLTKQIKNFEPDTGIPSIHTLVEYKFLSGKNQVSRIADEILADTRGYTAKEWRSFLYVIYETERFKRESEWRQLLRSCEVAENTSIVVLTGNPPDKNLRKTVRPVDTTNDQQ